MNDDDLGTEAELAHTRARVRAHLRRQWLAKGAGVAVTLTGLVLGLVLSFLWPDGFLRRWLIWMGLFAGGFVGSLIWRRLEPTEDIDDI